MGPAWPWLALGIAVLALLWAGRCLACALLPVASARSRWLATLVLAIGLQNVSALLLSPFQAATRTALLVVSLVLAAGLSPWGLRAGAARLLPLTPEDGPDERPTPWTHRPAEAERQPLAWLAVALAAAAVLVWYYLVIQTGLKLPEVSWDALAQHGASAAAWLQHRGIYVVRTDDYWLNVYPMNTEVSYFWLLVMLHRDNLLSLAQLPYALIGAVAAYTLARGWGARRPGAALAGLCYLLVPNVIVQSRTAYVDVAFCSLFLAALAFWDAARARGTWSRWLLFGIAMGLVAGTKPTGLLYGGALGIAGLLWPQVRALRTRRGRHAADRAAAESGGVAAAGASNSRVAPDAAAAGPRPDAHPAKPGGAGSGPGVAALAQAAAAGPAEQAAARPAAVAWGWRFALLLLPAFAFGLRWYLRTWLAYGNPLFPFPLAFHGHVFFHGPLPLSHITNGATPAPYQDKPDWYMIRMAWLGENLSAWYVSAQGWLGTAWPLLEFPALALFIVWGSRRAGAWPALAVTAFSFALQPLNWWPRYTMFLPALGAAALAALPLPTRWFKQVALLAMAALAVVGALGAAPRLFFFVPLAATIAPAQRQPGALFSPPSYGWTVSATHPGDRIGYAEGPTLLLPLYGQTFDRYVTYVGAKTKTAFLHNLRRDRITVFTTGRGSRYATWITSLHATQLTTPSSLVDAWRLAPPAPEGVG